SAPLKTPSRLSSAFTLKHVMFSIPRQKRGTPVLLPDKHVRICESILGLAALVLANLTDPLPFDKLMAVLAPQFETPAWPAYHNGEICGLGLCFLFAAGLVDVSVDGDLFRCD